MATKKFSALSTGTTANGTDKIPMARSGANFYITPAMIWTYIQGLLSYKPGGTDVALADGGTGASLADPNADRILFWDDSAGAMTWLTPGTGLTITTTTIDASGGGSSTGLVARYHLTSDLTLNSATATRFNATVNDYDPGADVTTGASWVYTAPATAWYEVKLTFALLIANGNAWQNDKGAEANLKMNAGTYVGMMRYERTNSADGTGQFLHMGGSLSVSCTAGDTLYVEIYNGTGATRKMEADSTIEIYKVT